jgi:hypothetical protein
MNTYFKIFQAFATKNEKNSIEDCSYMLVLNGMAYLTNLEDTLQFPCDLPDGHYHIINNEPFKMKDYDPEKSKFCFVPELQETDVQIVAKAGLVSPFVPHVEKDDFRPQMNGICINNIHIAATDAHTLRYHKFNEDDIKLSTTSPFEILLTPTLAVLSPIKHDPDQALIITRMQTIEEEESRVRNYLKIDYQLPHCTIYQREIDAKFPSFLSVIPNYKAVADLQCFSIPTNVVKEVATFAKKIQRTLARVYTENNKIYVSVSNSDTGISKKWEIEAHENIFDKKTPDGIQMPMMLNEKHMNVNPGDIVGINASILPRFATSQGNVVIGVIDPTRAMAVYLEKQEKVTGKPKPIKEVKTTTVKTQVTSPDPAPVPLPEPEPEPLKQKPNIEVKQYSERAIVVLGDTFEYSEKFSTMYGIRKHVKVNNKSEMGWVFSKKREKQILELIENE